MVSPFEFLGSVVHYLNYWGSKPTTACRWRVLKLDPINQFFLMLVKLKLNLKVADLAYRFGLSQSQVLRYITTWVCFLYNHIIECLQSKTYWEPYHHPSSKTIPQLMPSFMEVKCLLRHHQTFTCNHQHGVPFHHNAAKFL